MVVSRRPSIAQVQFDSSDEGMTVHNSRVEGVLRGERIEGRGCGAARPEHLQQCCGTTNHCVPYLRGRRCLQVDRSLFARGMNMLLDTLNAGNGVSGVLLPFSD